MMKNPSRVYLSTLIFRHLEGFMGLNYEHLCILHAISIRSSFLKMFL